MLIVKKVSLLSILLVALLLFTGCRNKETQDDINDSVPEEVVAYQNYLNDTNPVIIIEVAGYGTMVLQLFYDVAPNTVRNIIKLIEDHYYEDVLFHRVIENFMIQGGWGEPLSCAIQGEFLNNGIANPLQHTRGVISMARTMNPNSATSQFFIMHQTTQSLDSNYAAFGGLVSGFDVLDAIATTATNQQDSPVTDIVITRITVNTKGLTYDDPVCHG